jgi:hypothetical protein
MNGKMGPGGLPYRNLQGLFNIPPLTILSGLVTYLI